MSHSAQLALEIGQTYRVMDEMKAARALILGLVAALNTAIWGLILHFGSRELGVPIGPAGLSVLMLGIFVLLLLILGLVALASDSDGQDK